MPRLSIYLSLLGASCGLPPAPLALFSFQETAAPYKSTVGSAYALYDGNSSAPIVSEVVPGGGVFGPRAVRFNPVDHSNNSARLFAPRAAAPLITSGISGPKARVTIMAWVQMKQGAEAFVAGAWDEYGRVGGRTGARQYALFTNLAVCHNAPTFVGGCAAHISPVGGPTPGYNFSETAACDPRPLPDEEWVCLAGTYDDEAIRVYVNGTFISNGERNPYPLLGGIYDAEGSGGFGAEFGVGLNRINATLDGAKDGYRWANRFEGLIGGIAVWNVVLNDADIKTSCIQRSF